MVYIPFVIDNATTVNAVLAVNMEVVDTSWQVLYANNYTMFGFDTTNSSNWNARDVYQFFALFDYDIFGHTKFRLKDSMLFNSQKNSIITLKSIGGVPVNGRTNRVADYVDVCTIWEICDPPPGGGGDPIAPGGGGSQVRINSCYYTTNCVTYYFYNWSSGTGGGSGSGGGGGGSGGWWSGGATCTNTATGTPIACPPGWVPYDGPYILTEDDIRIWNQIEQEDAEADNLAPLDCQGTGRVGNINWQGVLEHNLIQLDYVTNHPLGRREYQIPNAGTVANAPGYADLVNLEFDIIWEIKPAGTQQQAAAELEVTNYVLKANTYCNSPSIPGGPSRVWDKGTGYAPHYFPSKYADKYLSAYEASPGVILYEYVPKNTVPVPVPVVLPVNIIDKLKELIDKLKENVSKFKEVISEYLRDHPELVTFLKAAAWTAAVAIVVGTIIEDFFSGGAGILDDIACFRLAYQIVRFAQAL